MQPQRGRIDRSGRLVIPAPVRRELELRDGDELTFVSGETPGEVRLVSRRAAVRRAQALVRQYALRDGSAVDELLAERRRDAELEEAEFQEHSQSLDRSRAPHAKT